MSRGGRARLSNLMDIHKALRIVFTDPQRSYAWTKAVNADFAGSSALDVRLGGGLTDITRVRRYLVRFSLVQVFIAHVSRFGPTWMLLADNSFNQSREPS